MFRFETGKPPPVMVLFFLFVVISLAMASGQECGRRTIEPGPTVGPTFKGAIIGGKTAVDGSWPWQVMLEFRQEPICGGTLIDKEWVLTAAHCVKRDKPDPFFVYPHIRKYRFVLGAYNKNEPDEPHRVTRKASKIIVHRRFTTVSKGWDIALIKLSAPVNFTSHISSACLPTRPPSPGTMAWVTGWGSRTELKSEHKSYLQQASVPVVEQATCARAYRSRTKINKSMICAGFEAGGKDTCGGDSGGPMVTKDDASEKWYVVGVTSWGTGCGRPGYYGVYTNTTFFHDWLNKTMSKNM